MHCNAFTDTHEPCLTPVHTERGVCSEHTDYYDEDRWLNRFPFNPDLDYAYYFCTRKKLKHIYHKAILEKYIVIKENHFKDLLRFGDPIETLQDYYLLCCMQPGVDPLWSIKIFKRVVQTMVDTLTFSHDLVKENKDLLYRHLDPLFNNDVRSFDSIVYRVLYYMTQVNISATLKMMMIDPIDTPLNSLIQYIKDHPKFKSEFVWKESKYKEAMLKMLSQQDYTTETIQAKVIDIVQDLSEEAIKIRESRKKDFLPMADEIVSLSWAPERFVDWCLSVDEQDEIRTRWSIRSPNTMTCIPP